MSDKFTLAWDADIPMDIAVGDTLEFYNAATDVTDAYAVLGINEDGIVVKKLEVSND